jgi:hypothetical protein
MSTLLFPLDLPRTTLLEKADTIADWLERCVPKKKQSRIHDLIRRVRQNAGKVVPKGDKDHHHLAHAMKDLQEFWYIATVLGEEAAGPPYIDVLERSLRDPVLQEDTGEDTQGRDAQFELFIAALGRRAHLKVAREDSGPDWLFSSVTRTWSVEAKRVKEWNSFEGTVRKARRQIRESNVGGVIIIDTSMADDRGLPITPGPLVNPQQLLDGYSQWFRDNHLQRVRSWIGTAPVGKLILHGFVLVPGRTDDPNADTFGLHAFWANFDLQAGQGTQAARYEEFSQLFSAVLPQY